MGLKLCQLDERSEQALGRNQNRGARNGKFHISLNGAVNSIISSSWSNQTYSAINSFWLTVCKYEISANRTAVSLSALASFQYATNKIYTINRALLAKIVIEIRIHQKLCSHIYLYLHFGKTPIYFLNFVQYIEFVHPPIYLTFK